MEKLSRRTFSRYLLAATTLPLKSAEASPLPQISSATNPTIPDIIAGYRLTADDKRLAEKFFAMHEKNMASLRERELPSALAPAFLFATPKSNGETGDAKK
jgi:hypothetical protein